jgi:hypothetical protein
MVDLDGACCRRWVVLCWLLERIRGKDAPQISPLSPTLTFREASSHHSRKVSQLQKQRNWLTAVGFREFLHARVAQSRHRVFPVPVGLSSNAFVRCRI